MRLFKTLLTTATAGSLALLAACSTTGDYNPTTFQYQIDEALIAERTVKTVIIPHVNLGAPSRKYLESEAPRIDGLITTYLKENGYKVLPQREFQQHWNTAVRAYGNPVDPTTGKINQQTFAKIMVNVRDQLKDRNLDAFVFTDLIEFDVAFSGGMKHLARWDGVTRKPSLQGPGEGISAGFNWNEPAAVASLQVSIYNMDLKRLFASRGGMDATDAIDTRSSRFARRRNMLENEDNLMEGITLALHPFIAMEDWPGNP
jgi:hypothetical protein